MNGKLVTGNCSKCKKEIPVLDTDKKPLCQECKPIPTIDWDYRKLSKEEKVIRSKVTKLNEVFVTKFLTKKPTKHELLGWLNSICKEFMPLTKKYSNIPFAECIDQNCEKCPDKIKADRYQELLVRALRFKGVSYDDSVG